MRNLRPIRNCNKKSHNAFEISYNYRHAVSSQVFQYTADSDNHNRIYPLVSVSENHFPVTSFFPFLLCNQHSPHLQKTKTRGNSLSLNPSSLGQFLFTVLSEPSQDSSLGQFLFTVLSEPSQDSSLMKKNYLFSLILYPIR